MHIQLGLYLCKRRLRASIDNSIILTLLTLYNKPNGKNVAGFTNSINYERHDSMVYLKQQQFSIYKTCFDILMSSSVANEP